MGTTDDRTAIIDTLQRYGWTIDEFDWAAVGAVFTDDADVRYGAYPPLVGGEATAAFLAGRCEGIAWHQHQVQPMRIDIDGDTATTLSYFTAHPPADSITSSTSPTKRTDSVSTTTTFQTS